MNYSDLSPRIFC